MDKNLTEALIILAGDSVIVPAREHINAVFELLKEAQDHLDYIGYGDKWEREVSGDLRDRLNSVMELRSRCGV